MKRTKTIEIDICDFCGRESCFNHCARCGKNVRFTCEKKPDVGTQYDTTLRFSVGGDPWYCRECDIELHEHPDQRFLDLCAMRDLRTEIKAANDRWDARRKTLEARLGR